MALQTVVAAGPGAPQARHWLWDAAAGPVRGLLALWLALLVAALDAQGALAGQRLNERAFDAQARWLRAWRQSDPAPAATDARGAAEPVLVGVDDASLAALGLPLGLLHGALGEVLEAVAAAGARGIGLDIALPERAYGGAAADPERRLLRGLLAARQSAALVVALDIDAAGRVRVPHGPLVAAAGGAAAFGLPLFPIDCDGVVRRFDPAPTQAVTGCAAGVAFGMGSPDGAPPAFAAALARRLGRSAAVGRPAYIDYTRGPAFSYVPLYQVLRWHRQGDVARLRERFGGRVVLVGSMLPDLDRLPVPLPLTEALPPQPAPGLVLNAQVLRGALDAGLVRALAPGWSQTAVLLGAALALPAAPALRAGLLVLWLLAALAGGTVLHGLGWYLQPGGIVVAATAAVLGRMALDLAAARHERARVARALRGYLSPAPLHALLQGSPEAQVLRGPIAALFADLRDFTARSEGTDPAQVRDVLNRYYAAVTPVLHAHGGSIDNFRGDGVMVTFGAPAPLAQPCDAALAAAAAVLTRVAQLNREELLPAGIAPLEVSLGLAYGEAVYGQIGSADRRDFTALGDVVNVAAHLQALARRDGYPVLMSERFAQRLTAPLTGAQALGEQAFKGHTPLRAVAWRPPTRQDADRPD